MQSHTIVTRRLFSFLITVMLLSTPLMAQSSVKIKSRVEIKPDSIQSKQGSINQLKKTSDETGFWILPRSGILELYYSLYTMDNPIPENSYIVITVGSKIYHYNMFPYLKYGTEINHHEGHCTVYEPAHLDYSYGPDESSQRIFIMGHANDTVRAFYYTSEGYNFSITDTYEWGCLFGYSKPMVICPCLRNDPNNSFKYSLYPESITCSLIYRDEIMLGESKYLQASYVYDESYQQVYLNELTDPEEHVGDVAQGITFTVEPLNGSKCGVYWEQVDTAGKPDPTGDIIRLIGRYWEKDSTFAVKVTAWYSGINSDYWTPTTIYTSAPDRLLTPGQSPTYTKTLDVFNNERNIDSICIYYGGKYGIPPHFLKGQMLKEAGTINYAGDKGFAPSYRYEPFSRYGQLSKKWKTESQYKLWFVDTTRIGHEMGNGKNVPTHYNVCNMPYPTSPKKVWNILEENSELVTCGSGLDDKAHRVYGSRLSSGKMIFPKEYYGICKKYAQLLKDAEKKAKTSSKTKEEIAREKMIEYLHDEWEGGAIKMVAQTRLASSYGLFQMLYGTAVWQLKYPTRNSNISPEDFNVTDTNMTYSLRYMKKLLSDSLTSTVEESGNWPGGFEHWFKEYLWRMWHTQKSTEGVGYANDVYSNMKRFYPQNK